MNTSCPLGLDDVSQEYIDAQETISVFHTFMETKNQLINMLDVLPDYKDRKSVLKLIRTLERVKKFLTIENFLDFDHDILDIFVHISNAYENNWVIKVKNIRENTRSINRTIDLVQSSINRLKRLIQNVEKYVLNTRKDARRNKVLDQLSTIRRGINFDNLNKLEDPVEELNRQVLILCGSGIKELDADFNDALDFVVSQL